MSRPQWRRHFAAVAGPVARLDRAARSAIEALEARTLFSTVNVASYGSVQAAINASAPGDTVDFGSGTYNLNGGSLNLLSNRTYSGSATINKGGSGPAVNIINAGNMVIDGLTFNGGGFNISDGDRVTITNCTVENTGGGNYAVGAGVYFSGLTNSTIAWNAFYNIGGWGGIVGYNPVETHFDHNYFNNSYEGIHLFQSQQNATGVTVNYNVGVGTTRAGLEIQDTYVTNEDQAQIEYYVGLQVIGNWWSSWNQAWRGSNGNIFACAYSIPVQFSTGTVVANNYAGGGYAWALEACGQNYTISGNTFQETGTWIIGVDGYTKNMSITGNNLQGNQSSAAWSMTGSIAANVANYGNNYSDHFAVPTPPPAGPHNQDGSWTPPTIVVTPPSGGGTPTSPDPTPTPAPLPNYERGNGLQGDYFNSPSQTTPVLERTDDNVNFDWSASSPDPTAVNPNSFAVQWTGKVRALYDETYTFYTTTAGGVRLWVNGQLIVDDWGNHASTEDSGTITLQAGTKYDFKLEYYADGVDPAGVKVEWSSASQARQIIPKDWLYSGDAADTPDDQGLWGTPVDSTDGNGVLKGAPVWTNGYTGATLSEPDLNTILGSSAAVTFQVRTTQVGTDDAATAPSLAGAGDGGSNEVKWGWLDGTGRMALQADAGSAARTVNPINDGGWHKVVLVRDAVSGMLEIYVDGVLNDATLGTMGNMPTAFGSFGRLGGLGFAGDLANLRVYAGELTQPDITTLAGGGQIAAPGNTGATPSTPVVSSDPPASTPTTPTTPKPTSTDSVDAGQTTTTTTTSNPLGATTPITTTPTTTTPTTTTPVTTTPTVPVGSTPTTGTRKPVASTV